MIHVIATIEIRPGPRDAFLAEFRKVVPLVLAEAGCLAYGPTVDLPTEFPAQPPARDDVVTVVEAWESVGHLKAHAESPHMTEYRAAVTGMVVKTTLGILTPV